MWYKHKHLHTKLLQLELMKNVWFSPVGTTPAGRAGQGCWLWQAGWDLAGPQDLLHCWGCQQFVSALGR